MLNHSEIVRIKNEIKTALNNAASITPRRTLSLLPTKGLVGKLYEVSVLAEVLENLKFKEGLKFKLKSGSVLRLKLKGGKINRSYPYFEVYRGSTLVGEIFTDLYFNSLSYDFKGSPPKQQPGDYHELDIAMIKPGLHNKPKNDDVYLAVECKNTSVQKKMIREILGFRRELSMVSYTPKRTEFRTWPAHVVHSSPGSVHMLYCSHDKVLKYQDNCFRFGIFVTHYLM